jgi:hypothetical protein
VNKQKLISALQSRIAKRKQRIKAEWEIFHSKGLLEYDIWSMLGAKEDALKLSIQQKQDKQILNQLIVDERELKELREIRKLMFGEY